MLTTESAPRSSGLGDLANRLVIRGQKSASPNRFACIDLLRTIAIVTTIAMHLIGSGVSEPVKDWLYPIFFHGAYGVIIFFAVSGFVISYTTAARDKDLCKINVKTFYRNRAARILPLLFLILGLGYAFREWPPLGKVGVYWACFENPLARYDWSFWLSIPTFWFNWVKTCRGGHFGLHWDVMWTLSIEEQFYVLFPLVLLAAKNTRNYGRILAAFVVAGPLLRLAKYTYHPTKLLAAGIHSLSTFEQIAIGCIVFLLWNKYQSELRSRPKVQWALTICGALIASATYYFTSPFSNFDAIFAPTLLAGGVGAFMLGSLGLSVFEKLPKVLLAPGHLSYGMYLYQAIALYFCFDYLHGQPYLMVLPAFLLAEFAVAWVSFRFFELPLNKLFRAKSKESIAISGSESLPTTTTLSAVR